MDWSGSRTHNTRRLPEVLSLSRSTIRTVPQGEGFTDRCPVGLMDGIPFTYRDTSRGPYALYYFPVKSQEDLSVM